MSLVAIIAIVVAVHGWEWLRETSSALPESRSTTIRNLGLLVGGLVALILASWRSWVSDVQVSVAQQQANTAQEGVLHDQFQRGAEMLGSGSLSTRLGGVFVLRRLAEEHPDEYHIQVMELFCAFVRNPVEQIPFGTLEDLQEIMTAIVHRSQEGLEIERDQGFVLDLRFVHLPRVDLTLRSMPTLQNRRRAIGNLAHADLTGATLSDSLLSSVDFSDSVLDGAVLTRASCGYAIFAGAQLVGTNMESVAAQYADFSGANLSSAQCKDAYLGYSNFSRAFMPGTNMVDARLWNANLSGTIFGRDNGPFSDVPIQLTQRQLDEAVANREEPPQLIGTYDTDTGQPLVWRGKRVPPDHPFGS